MSRAMWALVPCFLIACTGEDGTADPTADDPSPATTDDYGPDNGWDVASADDVPSDLASTGSGFSVGDVIANATLVDQHGDEVELYQFYGKVLLLDVFAMWCGPCQEHAPEGENIYQELLDEDVVVIALMQENLYGPDPTVEDAATWANTHGLTHPVLVDDGQIYGYFATQGGGFPTYPVIGPDMTVVDIDLWNEGVNAEALRGVLGREGVW